jgi:hypothetical protein
MLPAGLPLIRLDNQDVSGRTFPAGRFRQDVSGRTAPGAESGQLSYGM